MPKVLKKIVQPDISVHETKINPYTGKLGTDRRDSTVLANVSASHAPSDSVVVIWLSPKAHGDAKIVQTIDELLAKKELAVRDYKKAKDGRYYSTVIDSNWQPAGSALE